ncbi:MAG TPA: WD40 repeat domain-containing protein [Anaerolineales bacterium]|nr:WD40 repeat domain-containing protein [Anaerolineales bacterium]
MPHQQKFLFFLFGAASLLFAACSAPPPTPTPIRTQLLPPATPFETSSPTLPPPGEIQAPAALLSPISPGNAASIIPLMRLTTDEPVALVWSPRGDWLGMIASREVIVFHPAALNRPAEQSQAPAGATLQLVTTNPADVRLSPDGQLVGVLHPDGFAIHIWEVASGTQSRTLAWREHAAPALYGVVFSPDWNSLAWFARGTVQFTDVRSGQLGPAVNHEDFIQSVTFSPDGDFFASAAGGTIGDQFQPLVLLWDVGDGEPLAQLSGHALSANRLEFSADNRLLAAAAGDGSLVVWDLKTRTLLATLHPEPAEILDFAFTPDGEFLVSVSSDGSARLWDLARELQLRAWKGLSAAVSPEGLVVALQPAEGPLQLIDAASGEKLVELDAPPGLVGLGFSPEGRLLAALSPERTGVLVWGSLP